MSLVGVHTQTSTTLGVRGWKPGIPGIPGIPPILVWRSGDSPPGRDRPDAVGVHRLCLIFTVEGKQEGQNREKKKKKRRGLETNALYRASSCVVLHLPNSQNGSPSCEPSPSRFRTSQLGGYQWILSDDSDFTLLSSRPMRTHRASGV